MAFGDNEINICSRALAAIGANAISSFEEGTTEAEIAAAKYKTAKKDLLSIYCWTFALSETYMPQLKADEEAIYKYLYELPEDCLRVITVYDSVYTFRFGKLNTNNQKPVLQYIADVSEEAMPAYFVTALIDRLARDFLIPITAKNSDYSLFDNIYQRTLANAKNIDAQSKTPSRIKNFAYIGVR